MTGPECAMCIANAQMERGICHRTATAVGVSPIGCPGGRTDVVGFDMPEIRVLNSSL